MAEQNKNNIKKLVAIAKTAEERGRDCAGLTMFHPMTQTAGERLASVAEDIADTADGLCRETPADAQKCTSSAVYALRVMNALKLYPCTHYAAQRLEKLIQVLVKKSDECQRIYSRYLDSPQLDKPIHVAK